MTDTLYGWWFSPLNKKLGYGDGREVRIGRTHKIEGKPLLCERGLHASESPLDALEYAPSFFLYRVRLSGEIVRGEDKACGTERTYLQGGDVSNVIKAFARKCALDVIHLWGAPSTVKEYLETGDEGLKEIAKKTMKKAEWAAWEEKRITENSVDWALGAANWALYPGSEKAAIKAAQMAIKYAENALAVTVMEAGAAAWPVKKATWVAVRKQQNSLLLGMLKKEWNI